MKTDLTRRQFMLLSCMAGASAALTGSAAALFGSRRRVSVALIVGPNTRTDHLLALADCRSAEIVGISGVAWNNPSRRPLFHHPTFARAASTPNARDLLANAEAVVWLDEDKSDPVLTQAISSGKHVLLESPLMPDELAEFSSLRPTQVVDVMPRRLPVQGSAAWLMDEKPTEVTIVRKSESFPSTADWKWLHALVQDEFAIALELLANVDLVPRDVAFGNTLHGPIWSARFAGDANGERCAVYAYIVPDKYMPLENTITLRTRTRSASLPVQDRGVDATRLYFDYFATAAALGDPSVALGTLEDARAVASVVASTRPVRGI